MSDKSTTQKKTRKAKGAVIKGVLGLASDLRSVARPKQGRSEATLQRLLDAAEKLICRDGLAGVSIASIVREAKSSVGGFYARFRDKDELLRALHERELGRINDQVGELLNPERWDGVPLRAIIHALIYAYAENSRGRERLQAAILEATARNPDAWAPAFDFRREVTDSVAALLLMRRDEITHPDPEQAVRFALSQAFAVRDIRSLYAHTDVVQEVSDEATSKEMIRSMMAYLTMPNG
ncbi:MAG: TetR/AcrR family transcriptional regulator [Polyangiales bacterium]